MQHVFLNATKEQLCLQAYCLSLTQTPQISDLLPSHSAHLCWPSESTCSLISQPAEVCNIFNGKCVNGEQSGVSGSTRLLPVQQSIWHRPEGLIRRADFTSSFSDVNARGIFYMLKNCWHNCWHTEVLIKCFKIL